MSLAALADPKQLLRGMAAPDLRMAANRRSEITARLQSGTKLTAEREYLETALHRLLAAREAPYPNRLKSDELGRQLATEAASKKLVVLDLLLPSLGRRTTAEAECLARLRLGWTAVALEQFRAAHGNRYPATLSELTPGHLSTTPTDPFDGHPLRYQKKGVGYALYSIGPDLKDDSGERKTGTMGISCSQLLHRRRVRETHSTHLQADFPQIVDIALPGDQRCDPLPADKKPL